jgi:hypothetical protein
MRVDEKMTKALKDPKVHLHEIQMDDARREKWCQVCDELTGVLMKYCETPVEARMILHHFLAAFDEQYSVQGVLSVPKGDLQ